MANNFSDTESDFYQYLTKYGNVSPRTRTNYLSWLKFLSKEYSIGLELNEEKIQGILKQEEIKRNQRKIYKKEKDVRNFYFALKKYLAFLDFDFLNFKENTIITELKNIEGNSKLTTTEKKSVILSRVGQGRFRKELINYWQGCSLSTFEKLDVLIASHIKPWKDANNSERIDLFNGLLLLPNYDKLFDKGYISFDENGKVKYSKLISKKDKNILGLNDNLKLIRIEDRHREYLNFHNENCFMK